MRLSKKLVSVLLSVLMVVSALPFSAVVAYAAPSTKKKTTSVASASSWYYADLYPEDKIYYFDSLQEAFEYVNTNPYCSTITLFKDVTLDEPIIYTDLEANADCGTFYLELNGKTVSAPNGNAFEFKDMYRNVFVGAYQWSYKAGDGITGYGTINAKDYAITVEDGNLVIEGGTYNCETTDCPWLVETDGYIGNIRHCSVAKNANTLYNEGYFGSNGNIYIRNKDNDINSLKHVTEKTVDETTSYIVADHIFEYTTKSVSADRQSAMIASECTVCHYQSGEYPALALVGDTAYDDFYKAVENADGSTVELLQDITVSNSVNIVDGMDITLDLNGHTITHPSGYFVINGGSLTVKDGAIDSDSNNTFLMYGTTDDSVERYSTLNLDNVDVANTYDGGSVNNLGSVIFLVNPGWSKPYKYYGITLNINESSLSSEGYCLVNNGNYANLDEFNTTKIDFTSSDLTSNQTSAMYIAGYALVNATATSFTGYISGAEIRAGVFNVLGDENSFTSTYTGYSEAQSNTSGPTTSGAALAIAQHNLAPLPNPVEVNIYGGTFTALTALKESNVQGVAEEFVDVTINIYGGDYIGEEASVLSDTCTGFISGGEFTVDPKESYIVDGKSTRIDDNDMYVLTDLDYSAYKTAVSIAKQIDRDIYTADSLLALDDAIVPDYTLTTQEEIDNATALVDTRYNELAYKSFTVTFVAEVEGDATTVSTADYTYGDIATLDATDIDGDVYKWTIEDHNTVKKLPSDSKNVSFVVKGDAVVTVYTMQQKTADSGLTKITYLSNKNVTIGIDYVSDTTNIVKPQAPEIPFYVFDSWETVDDTTYKAVYVYDDAKYCKFVGGMNVVITNGGRQSTNNDAGIDVPYDDIVEISKSVDGQLVLSADKEGKNILTYLNDVSTIHAPKRATVYVMVLPKRTDATIGVTGGYVKFIEGTKKKLAINGQFYIPTDCQFVETGAVLCNKNGDFKIGGAGVVKLASTMQSNQNEFTVTLTTDYGSMQYIFARTYLTFVDKDGNKNTIYSDVKIANIAVDGTLA